MVDADITLRDRIEAVLWANFDDAAPSLSMLDMADAVIEALGLTRFDAPPEYWYATTIWENDE